MVAIIRSKGAAPFAVTGLQGKDLFLHLRAEMTGYLIILFSRVIGVIEKAIAVGQSLVKRDFAFIQLPEFAQRQGFGLLCRSAVTAEKYMGEGNFGRDVIVFTVFFEVGFQLVFSEFHCGGDKATGDIFILLD